MNYLALLAGILVLLAASVHAVVGGREFGMLKPEGQGKPLEVWVQTLAGWHWVSVDQVLAAVALLVMGGTDWLGNESVILRVLAVYFGFAGLTWLITVVWAGRQMSGYWYRLGQWIYCFLIAGLALLAAR